MNEERSALLAVASGPLCRVTALQQSKIS